MVTVSSLGASGGADAIVWGLGTNHQGTSGTGKLTAFDGDTGAVLVQSTTTMGDLEHWISPIAVNGRLYFAGDHGIYAFDLDGPAHPADAGPTVAPADAGVPNELLSHGLGSSDRSLRRVRSDLSGERAAR